MALAHGFLAEVASHQNVKPSDIVCAHLVTRFEFSSLDPENDRHLAPIGPTRKWRPECSNGPEGGCVPRPRARSRVLPTHSIECKEKI